MINDIKTASEGTENFLNSPHHNFMFSQYMCARQLVVTLISITDYPGLLIINYPGCKWNIIQDLVDDTLILDSHENPQTASAYVHHLCLTKMDSKMDNKNK